MIIVAVLLSFVPIRLRLYGFSSKPIKPFAVESNLFHKEGVISCKQTNQGVLYQQGYYMILYSHKLYRFVLILKLFAKQSLFLPTLKTIMWRSTYIYKTKKDSHLKLGFLINLYFLLGIRFFKSKLLLGQLQGLVSSVPRGWLLTYGMDNLVDSHHLDLEKFTILCLILNRVFVEYQKVSLFGIDSQWSLLNPRDWFSLPHSTWHKVINTEDFELLDVINYVNLHSQPNLLQLKVLFNLPKVMHLKKRTVLSAWFLKVLSLRLFQYPVIYQLSELRLLSDLASFSVKEDLAWERLMDPDHLWQVSPITIKLINIVTQLCAIYKKGAITELLMRKAWTAIFEREDSFGYMIRYDLIFNKPQKFLRLLSKKHGSLFVKPVVRIKGRTTIKVKAIKQVRR